MNLTNSYIFLLKENEIKKDSKGNSIITIGDNVLMLFQKIFDVKKEELQHETFKDSKDTENSEKISDLFYIIHKGKFEISLDEFSIYEANFKLICVNSTYYLDIDLEIDNDENGIAVLEKIDDIMLDDKNKIKDNYIIIKSYDNVSEWYCNKTYPKLNRFERKLRKLLYLIYTGRFEKDYFKKTTSEELQSSVKEIIQSKKSNKKEKEFDYARVFFESFDFGKLQDLLFEIKWTEVEKIEIENFLNDNSDLTKLSDEELREFIQSIKPKSDWERFFQNKGLSEDIKESIKDIGRLRNRVAHSKSFNKKQYIQMVELLEKNEAEIDEAITITEDKDFIKINEEKIQRTLKNFANSMKEMVLAITNTIRPLYERQTENLNGLSKILNEMTVSFYNQESDGDK